MRKMQLIVPLRLRKVIFTLMLTIVSSVWMMKAACLMQAPEAMYQPFETVSGTLTSIGFPCEGEEPCPPCLTIALVTDAKTYYLSTSDAQMQAQLDELEMQLPLRATISGTPFVNGSFDFIKVQSVSVDNSLLPSLCDEWNVLEFRSHMGYAPDEYNMRRYHLTTDTIIAGQRYIRLYRDNSYIGAMREGNNRDIYYIPAGTTHEYLLYAFNAQIGDELTDLWLGRTTNEVFTKEYFPYGVNATVEEITETSPRRFVLSTGYITTEEGVENYPYYFEWIEGIGFASAPDGADYPLPYAGGFTSFLLCAYKNGEHIYTSEWGEQYGCEYNKKPINSLCDEWNVLYEAFSWPGGYRTDIFYLSTDTIINEQRYAKLVLNSDNRTSYKGAFREAENKNIYYYPAGSTHEYLLYAFNAQVGDTLSNLWIGGWLDTCPEEGWQGIVQSISNGNPRTFNVGIQIPELYGDNLYPLYWIEGVGQKKRLSV